MGDSIGTLVGGGLGFMVGGPAGAALGASLGGGYDASRLTGRASDAMQDAARRDIALRREMWQQGRADLAPWRQAGTQALGDMQNMLSGDYDIATDPGYQFRMNQGVAARDASAAARGNLLSGGQLKELTGFGQGLASQEYGNRFNRLASMAGLGQTATGQGVNLGQNYAAGAGNAMYNMGQARASGYMGQANAMNNALNQGLQLYGYGNQQGWWG